MRILFFGVGALGTLYAAKLALAGNDVTLLARGARLAALRDRGLVLVRKGRAQRETCTPRVTETLASETPYDLVIVLVRRAQVDEALRTIAGDHRGDALVMVNDARGYDAWRALLGERLVVGFAGALGVLDDAGVLTYQIAPRLVQPTVIGEPDGRTSERVQRIAAMLRAAGFPVVVRSDMEAWQKTHAAWITPFMLLAAVASARSLADGELARTGALAMRETLAAVRASGTQLSPPGLRLLAWVPASIAALGLRLALAIPPLRRELVRTGIASAAEGVTLVDDLVALSKEQRLPALARLRDAAIAAGSGDRLS